MRALEEVGCPSFVSSSPCTWERRRGVKLDKGEKKFGE